MQGGSVTIAPKVGSYTRRFHGFRVLADLPAGAVSSSRLQKHTKTDCLPGERVHGRLPAIALYYE
jgi:hypothetical protein